MGSLKYGLISGLISGLIIGLLYAVVTSAMVLSFKGELVGNFTQYYLNESLSYEEAFKSAEALFQTLLIAYIVRVTIFFTITGLIIGFAISQLRIGRTFISRGVSVGLIMGMWVALFRIIGGVEASLALTDTLLFIAIGLSASGIYYKFSYSKKFEP